MILQISLNFLFTRLWLTKPWKKRALCPLPHIFSSDLPDSLKNTGTIKDTGIFFPGKITPLYLILSPYQGINVVSNDNSIINIWMLRFGTGHSNTVCYHVTYILFAWKIYIFELYITRSTFLLHLPWIWNGPTQLKS